MVKRKGKEEAVKLERTKGTFRLVGKISRVQEGGKFPSWREDVGKEGSKREGDTYRSLRFSVITSKDGDKINEIPVEMFAFEDDFVYVYSKETKKTEKVPLDELQNVDPEDMILGTRFGLAEKDDDGNYIDRDNIELETLPNFEAIEAIYDNIENGDDVYLNGDVEHSKYIDKNGKPQQQTRYKIKGIGTPKRVVDFEDPKFREKAYFEDEFVFVDAEVDKKAKQTIVSGKSIDHAGVVSDVTYRIDFSHDTDEGVEEEDKLEDFAKGIAKEAEFGDVLSVWGRITNEPRIENVVDDRMARMGVKKSKPVANGVDRYLDIIGLDAGSEKKPKEFWIEGKYTEDDFLEVEAEDKPEERFASSRRRGKSKPKVDEDFEGDPIDISDDDLPF